MITVHSYECGFEEYLKEDRPDSTCIKYDSRLCDKLDEKRLPSERQAYKAEELSDDSGSESSRLSGHTRDKNSPRVQAAFFLDDQVEQTTKAECRIALTRLFFSNTSKSPDSRTDVIENALTEISDLYVVFPRCGPGDTRNMRQASNRSLLSSSSASLYAEEENSLRGLESLLCVQLVSGLRSNHIQNVLSAATMDGSSPKSMAEKIRKASLQTSRPSRHMALQMAKYDTRQALKSVLSKW